MNAKRNWNMRTILLGLIIILIVLVIIYVLFFSPRGDNTTPTVLSVTQVLQNLNKYVNQTITVEGYYYQFEGPSLVSATTVSEPNPTQRLNLDETSFNSAKQAAGNLTVQPNLKYKVAGVLEEIILPVGSDYKLRVESIRAV